MMNFFIYIMVVFISAIYLWRTIVKNKCDINNMVRNCVTDIDDSILDSFITRTFDEILVLNIEYFNIVYVKEKDIRNLQKLLSNRVASRISPSLINRLAYIYNKKNMSKVIAEKCYMYVIAWAKEINSVAHQEKENLHTEYTMFDNAMNKNNDEFL